MRFAVENPAKQDNHTSMRQLLEVPAIAQSECDPGEQDIESNRCTPSTDSDLHEGKVTECHFPWWKHRRQGEPVLRSETDHKRKHAHYRKQNQITKNLCEFII
jgi:hypothetical protein